MQVEKKKEAFIHPAHPVCVCVCVYTCECVTVG